MTTFPATQATLAAVWKAAVPGDVIRVSGPLTGPFSGIVKAAPGVTIVAEPGASIEPHPTSKWFSATGIEGVSFVGFPVHCLMSFNGGGARISLENIDIFGPGAMIQFRGCVNADPSNWVGVFNSRFRGGANGVSAIDVRGITVTGNSFSGQPADAVQLKVFGDVLVERNTFTNFRGEPVHRDAIQLIAADQTKSIFNVVIRTNRYERGDGIPAQFIFLSDSAAGYDGLTITGNAAWGSSWHGITFSNAKNALIEDNFLQGSLEVWPPLPTLGGQVIVPWIKPINPGLNVVVRNNVLPPPSAPGDVKVMTTWLARNDDPDKAVIADLKAQLVAYVDAQANWERDMGTLVELKDALAARLAAIAKMAQSGV